MLGYLYGKKFGSKSSLSSHSVTLFPIGSGYFRAKPLPV